MQPEEVAGVHFLEHAVQLGGLVVQEAQRRHCSDKRKTDTHILPQEITLFFIQGTRLSLTWLNFPKALLLAPCLQPPAKTFQHFSFIPNILDLPFVKRMDVSHLQAIHWPETYFILATTCNF